MKITLKIRYALLSIVFFLTACYCINARENLQAATQTIPLTIQNLEVGDTIEIYRIAVYSQEQDKYVWSSAVSNWITNDSQGSIYRTLTPEKLDLFTTERAQYFCQLLLSGLKNESDGVANLEGYTFQVDEDKESYIANIDPGYYLILPKGIRRVYELKWIKVEPLSEPQIEYSDEAGDFFLPTIEFIKRESEEPEESIYRLKEEEITLQATIAAPHYSDMYAKGKRILNLTYVVPFGFSYQQDTFTISLPAESYTMAIYENATVYSDSYGNRLFFGTSNGYFYEMNGALLDAWVTEQEALEKYNVLHDSTYQICRQEIVLAKEEEGTEVTETETESELEEQTQTEENVNTQQGEELIVLEAVDESTILRLEEGAAVAVISLDTTAITEPLSLEYTIQKNEQSNDAGVFENLIALSYSTSPLNTNLICTQWEKEIELAYGISIVAMKGDGESINMSPEEKLLYSPRFSNVLFYLYQLTEIQDGRVSYEGDEQEIPPIYYYKEEEEKTYIYTFLQEMRTDEKGIACMSGITPTQYLIKQQVYPNGYTLSYTSIQIEETDWTNETDGEKQLMLELLWLDYKTVILPATGELGTISYIINGILISFGALCLLFYRIYPTKFEKMIEFIKK